MLISKAKTKKRKESREKVKIFYPFANKAPCATYVFMIVCGFFAFAAWENTPDAQAE